VSPEQQSQRVEDMNRLKDLRREREDALYAFARAEFRAVLNARLHGATWAEVGRALGVSAQAAQQKHRGPAPPAKQEPEGISNEELEVLIAAELGERRAPVAHLTLLR
jgi:hypothetical protein